MRSMKGLGFGWARSVGVVLLLAGLLVPAPTAFGQEEGDGCSIQERSRAPLSASGQQALEYRCNGNAPESDPGPAPGPSEVKPAHPVPVNNLVNNPLPDPAVGNGTHITQSEVSIIRFGNTAIAGYNDSTHFSDGGSTSFTGYSRSTNGGVTWTDMGEVPAGGDIVIGDPVLARRSSDGKIFFANLFCGPGFTPCPIGVSSSTDGGVTFGLPSQTWPAIPATDFADKEWMAVDNNSASSNFGRVYVTWTNFLPSGDSPILLAYSDDGTTWTGPITVSDTTCAPIAGFPHAAQGSQVVVGPTGQVYVSWECFGDTSNQIRFDVSTDGGATFGTDVVAASLVSFGGAGLAVCGGGSRPVYNGFVRANDFPSMDIDSVTGDLYIAYGDDIDGGGPDDAAVRFIRSTTGGTSWSSPKTLGGNANDQFFPMVRVDQVHGTVAVAWYDRRLDPGNLSFDVFMSISYDAGVTFGQLHRVTNVSSGVPQINPNFDTNVADCYMGDYNGMDDLPDGSGFLLGWGDNADPGPAGNNGVDQNIYAAIHKSFCPGHIGEPGNHFLGSGGNDVLNGTSGIDIMCGRNGDDLVRGKSGDDIIDGGGGNDEVIAGGGDDFVRGQGGNDLLKGNADNDDLRGGSGNDDLRGGGGNDDLFGSGGNDELRGQSGTDFGNGGNGFDFCIAETEVACEI